MLTQEQSDSIKEQLLKQLGNFPEDKREQIKEKIISMSLSEMEEFVKQNQLLSEESEEGASKCIFCLINQGKIKSFKVGEDKENNAILEINPASKGHVLVLPKEHLEILPKSTMEFAQKLAESIKKKLAIKEIKITENSILGHQLVEIIPQPENKRKKADEKELEELQQLLLKEEKKEEAPEIVQSSKEIKKEEKLHKRKPRIP